MAFLLLARYQNRMAVALAGVELTRVRDDPYVHFGDVLQVLHAGSGASLATDVEDKVGSSPLKPGLLIPVSPADDQSQTRNAGTKCLQCNPACVLVTPELFVARLDPVP